MPLSAWRLLMSGRLVWCNEVMEDGERLSPQPGSYPDGPSWSASEPEDERATGEDYTVEGPQVRIMWDEGAGPLWDEAGLLPDDPRWLQRALGLTDVLVGDLLAWLGDMTAHHRAPQGDDWKAGLQKLDERGQDLAARLQVEVGAAYTIRYHA
jgi:hypothetical protein